MSRDSQPLIFERSVKGRKAYSLPDLDVPEMPLESLLPSELLRETPPALPEVSEPDLVRHYTVLSRRNFGVDNGFYPLGSCTMKYNPKINEDAARLDGFATFIRTSRKRRCKGHCNCCMNCRRRSGGNYRHGCGELYNRPRERMENGPG